MNENIICYCKELCKSEPPPKDKSGKIKETPEERKKRIERNDIQKVKDEKIRETLSKDGRKENLKTILYKNGVSSKYGTGYDGKSCDIFLQDKKNVWDQILEVLNTSKHIKDIQDIVFKYRFIHYIMTSVEFNAEVFRDIENKFDIKIEHFESLISIYENYCRNWGKSIVHKLLHTNLPHYVHYVVYHSPQILKRDGSIMLFSGDGIEKTHQKIKFDIRKHLGSGSWTKTLLSRWLVRTSPTVLNKSPIK